MRPWQTAAQARIQSLLQALGKEAQFEAVPVKVNPAADHKDGDVYLRAAVNSKPRHVLYIYNDEAGINTEGEWDGFELPDWNNDPDALLDAFLECIRAKIVASAS